MEKLAFKKIKKWEISKCWNPVSNYQFFRVSDGWHVDYPIQYDNWHIVYDFPELVPKYIQKEVTKFIKKFN